MNFDLLCLEPDQGQRDLVSLSWLRYKGMCADEFWNFLGSSLPENSEYGTSAQLDYSEEVRG